MGNGPTAYDELYHYTMGRPGFILQHVVDANMAQRMDGTGPPIGAVFALVGLYLHVEKGFDGVCVQQAHKIMGRRKREWPAIVLPAERGHITPAEVMAAPVGAARDAAIDRWCESVWTEFASNRDVIVRLLEEYEII